MTRPYHEFYTFLAQALVPERRIHSIRAYVDSQYGKFDRKYHNLAYLTRVLQALDEIIATHNNLKDSPISDEDNEDLFAAALFHRIYLAPRTLESSHTIGFLTKKHLDQEYYPRPQKVATMAELTDFNHFRTGVGYGLLVDLLRDAILAEIATNPDEDMLRRLGNYRRDMGWDWVACGRFIGPKFAEWLKETPLRTDAGKILFQEKLDVAIKRLRHQLKQHVEDFVPEVV